MAVHHLAILAVLAAVVTRVENCDDIKVIAERNKRDWETIRLEFSTPGANNSDDGINSFFTRLNRYNAFHLVVLMERSAVLGRSEFYLRQRKLVEDILRYQVEMHAGFRNSQTNVITFAHKNSYTSFTGMDKNVFFTTSWHNVTYNPDKATGAVDIRLAYSAALEKFRTFPPTGVTRLLLVLASGEFTDSPDDLTLSTLQQLGVSVYVVQCGRVSEESQERLMGMASTPDQYGTFFEWMNASWVNGPPEDGTVSNHDDVIKWKHFPRYWPFVRGIHRSPVNSPHKGQWRGALMFSLICAWMNDWVNNREAVNLRPHRAHHDVTVMLSKFLYVSLYIMTNYLQCLLIYFTFQSECF